MTKPTPLSANKGKEKELIGKGAFVRGMLFFGDVVVVNFAVILSFAARFEFEVGLWQIYVKSWTFTLLVIVLVPLCLQIFFYNSKVIFKSGVLALSRLLFVVSLTCFVIAIINFRFSTRSLFILTPQLTFLFLSVVRLPWLMEKIYSSSLDLHVFERTAKKTHTRIQTLLGLFKPKKEDVKPLIINIFGSILGFLIIYYLLGFR